MTIFCYNVFTTYDEMMNLGYRYFTLFFFSHVQKFVSILSHSKRYICEQFINFLRKKRLKRKIFLFLIGCFFIFHPNQYWCSFHIIWLFDCKSIISHHGGTVTAMKYDTIPTHSIFLRSAFYYLPKNWILHSFLRLQKKWKMLIPFFFRHWMVKEMLF